MGLSIWHWLLTFVVAALLGLIPAIIARRKGRSFFAFWLFGAVAVVVALPWAILARPDDRVLGARRAR